MARFHNVNGVEVPFTAAEEAEWDVRAKEWKDGAHARALLNLREERNRKLAESDWIGLTDTALTNEQAAKWELYRQKLRDFPSGLTTEAKVKAVTWPAKP